MNFKTPDISEIAERLNRGELTFHQRMEHDMFFDIVDLYRNKRYAASAMIGAVLYEKLFTTRLIRETDFPNAPSRDNLARQIQYMIDREQEIIDGTDPSKRQGLSFKQVTQQLFQHGIISKEQQKEADDFYTKYRNPISHGLSYRLYETVFERKPNSTFQLDANYPVLYKEVAETMIREIYKWVLSEVLRKT